MYVHPLYRQQETKARYVYKGLIIQQQYMWTKLLDMFQKGHRPPERVAGAQHIELFRWTNNKQRQELLFWHLIKEFYTNWWIDLTLDSGPALAIFVKVACPIEPTISENLPTWTQRSVCVGGGGKGWEEMKKKIRVQ